MRPTGAQLVYDALRQRILSLALAPGLVLDEGPLCRQFRLSRTPVREALIRLASEGLVELHPNRGAKVASIDFAGVVDHYEAMDVFLPVVCRFAAVRRTGEDMELIRSLLAQFRASVARKDSAQMIRNNHDLHAAIALACHNRCIERGYRQMLADKLRLAQHGLPGTTYEKGRALADRFAGTARLSARLVRAIESRDAPGAQRLARELNEFVRAQVIGVLSASLGRRLNVPVPAAPRAGRRAQGRPALRAKKKAQPRRVAPKPPKEEGGGDLL